VRAFGEHWHNACMAASREQIAHLLRRTSFGPFVGQVESFDGLSIDDAVTRVMNTPPKDVVPPDLTDANPRAYDDMIHWWPNQMASDEAGLHEKMTFFWHALIPSSIEKCEMNSVLAQNFLLRRHALGNVRQLLQDITVDLAMLQYLDGAGSFATTPNENYARELMELFALGRDGGYTEVDVKAGARALAGYWIDWNNNRQINFSPESALGGPVDFLGRRVQTATDVVDTVVDHPSCAPYVAGKVHAFFCGVAPSPERRAELGQVLRDANMEIRPVVESVLRHPTFWESSRNRARTPVEWACTAARFLNVALEYWPLLEMGMRPLSPPNVAGWPSELNWLSAGAVFSWTTLAYEQSGRRDAETDLDALAARAGIFELSSQTRSSIGSAMAGLDPESASRLAHTLLLLAPEFVMA
jgi:uncharacterized protein (DUF1800 family)